MLRVSFLRTLGAWTGTVLACVLPIPLTWAGERPGPTERSAATISATRASETIKPQHLDAAVAADAEHPAKKLDLVWSSKGAWTSVATDPTSGAIYALGAHGTCAELDSEGETVRADELAGARGTKLRLARLGPKREVAFVNFDVWGDHDVKVYDFAGRMRWTHPEAAGVDDVWTGDLDGDGKDEVLVGYNGAKGLHALDEKGKTLWTWTEGGNLWSVSVGRLSGDEHQRIAVTAGSRILIVNPDGTTLRALDPGCFPELNRVVEATNQGGVATIVVTCHAGGRDETVTAISGDGAKRWSFVLPDDAEPRIQSASVARGHPWIAVVNGSGSLYVIDVESGAILAGVSDQGHRSELAWLATPGSTTPLLLVATGKEINAYRLVP